ncbi:MAG: YqgE/AlgH family protein [Acidimicrobiales bacterium]|nr:YqgE/AlgH family protein [Acidimicrobiales bacterium]
MPLTPFSEFEPYGGAEPPESLTGHLLVATPRLADPNFSRCVLLVLDHGMHGALGVILDRPGGLAVDEVLPQWQPFATAPSEVFTGGPVARNALIGLVRRRAGQGSPAPAGWRLLVDDDRPVGTVDLSTDPAATTEDIEGARLFSGYAGWDTDQLEGEILEGSWYVVPAQARDPISADPEGLWRRVLRREGGALALVSGYPPDPLLN